MPEYTWMFLNKQDSDYENILNMVAFSIYERYTAF